jgi:membrane fusion protein, copper/silver efflux system
MKTITTILLTAILTAAGTWYFLGHSEDKAPATGSAIAAEKKPHHYQCAMHPQVKSDKPGRCTICGMELTAIFEGDQGYNPSGGESIVPLTSRQMIALNVQTAAAKIQPLSKSLRVAGMIDDDATRHRILSAYVDGRVEKLHVNYMGAEVSQGQPLADFYSPTLLQTEREYRQLTGELKKSAGLRLRQMGLTPEQIAAVDEKPAEVLTTQILSPISGTVVGQEVYEGQYVMTGEKLFEIADFSTMWFMFPAYEQDMPWIELGQSVSVTTPSKPGKTFPGKVAFIDPNFDETTRSTKIRVELPNPITNGKRELLHRLYADATVEVKTPAVLAIPRTAVIQTGSQAVVYVDRGKGFYAQTFVKTGRRGDTLVEVLSGITEGDSVVVQGNLLIDGQAELNHSFSPPAAETAPSPALAAVAFTAPQQKAISEFVATADSMAAALAADDLAAFNKASEPAMQKTKTLAEALTGHDGIEALKASGHFHGFDDIKKARVAYYHFSQAATTVLAPIPPGEGVPEYQIWECPMVNEAIPGAGKKGSWIQTGGRPIGNPYFGSEMPTCGEQAKR